VRPILRRLMFPRQGLRARALASGRMRAGGGCEVQKKEQLP